MLAALWELIFWPWFWTRRCCACDRCGGMIGQNDVEALADMQTAAAVVGFAQLILAYVETARDGGDRIAPAHRVADSTIHLGHCGRMHVECGEFGGGCIVAEWAPEVCPLLSCAYFERPFAVRKSTRVMPKCSAICSKLSPFLLS